MPGGYTSDGRIAGGCTSGGPVSGSSIAVGLGCRAGCELEPVLQLLQRVLAAAGRRLADVAALHTADFKQSEPALLRAAELLHKPLLGFSLEQLRAHAAGALTQSPHTLQRFGVPSIAETAALAGATTLPRAGAVARLLAPRSSAGSVTCALAELAPVEPAGAELAGELPR